MEQDKHKNTKQQTGRTSLHLNAAAGEAKGELELSWEPFRRTYTYILQKCTAYRKVLKWRYEDILERP